MIEGTNITFVDAIVRASKMIMPKFSNEGQELAIILRSNEPLGTVERELLAQLVTGERSKPAGGQSKNYNDIMFEVTVAQYFKHRTEIDHIKKTAVYAECFEKFDISESTVRKYVKFHEGRIAAGIDDIPEESKSIVTPQKKAHLNSY